MHFRTCDLIKQQFDIGHIFLKSRFLILIYIDCMRLSCVLICLLSDLTVFHPSSFWSTEYLTERITALSLGVSARDECTCEGSDPCYSYPEGIKR